MTIFEECICKLLKKCVWKVSVLGTATTENPKTFTVGQKNSKEDIMIII